MSHKQNWLNIFSLLIVVSLTLAACGNPSQPAATATEAVATEATVTEAPVATEAPAETDSSLQANADNQCESSYASDSLNITAIPMIVQVGEKLVDCENNEIPVQKTTPDQEKELLALFYAGCSDNGMANNDTEVTNVVVAINEDTVAWCDDMKAGNTITTRLQPTENPVAGCTYTYVGEPGGTFVHWSSGASFWIENGQAMVYINKGFARFDGIVMTKAIPYGEPSDCDPFDKNTEPVELNLSNVTLGEYRTIGKDTEGPQSSVMYWSPRSDGVAFSSTTSVSLGSGDAGQTNLNPLGAVYGYTECVFDATGLNSVPVGPCYPHLFDQYTASVSLRGLINDEWYVPNQLSGGPVTYSLKRPKATATPTAVDTPTRTPINTPTAIRTATPVTPSKTPLATATP